MTINALVCHADGTQTVEQREVPEDWLGAAEKAPEDEASESGETGE